jgi:ABC-type multidrug transport system ATPase subunit
VAKADLVCRNLGIIKDGEVVADQALLEFARRFEGQVQPQVISALAALFKLNTDLGPCSAQH